MISKYPIKKNKLPSKCQKPFNGRKVQFLLLPSSSQLWILRWEGHCKSKFLLHLVPQWWHVTQSCQKYILLCWCMWNCSNCSFNLCRLKLQESVRVVEVKKLTAMYKNRYILWSYHLLRPLWIWMCMWVGMCVAVRVCMQKGECSCCLPCSPQPTAQGALCL